MAREARSALFFSKIEGMMSSEALKCFHSSGTTRNLEAWAGKGTSGRRARKGAAGVAPEEDRPQARGQGLTGRDRQAGQAAEGGEASSAPAGRSLSRHPVWVTKAEDTDTHRAHISRGKTTATCPDPAISKVVCDLSR